MNVVDFIIAYESGQLEDRAQYIDGFAKLIRTGIIKHLQGNYGRTAHALISAGYIDTAGKVLAYEDEEYAY